MVAACGAMLPGASGVCGVQTLPGPDSHSPLPTHPIRSVCRRTATRRSAAAQKLMGGLTSHLSPPLLTPVAMQRHQDGLPHHARRHRGHCGRPHGAYSPPQLFAAPRTTTQGFCSNIHAPPPPVEISSRCCRVALSVRAARTDRTASKHGRIDSLMAPLNIHTLLQLLGPFPACTRSSTCSSSSSSRPAAPPPSPRLTERSWRRPWASHCDGETLQRRVCLSHTRLYTTHSARGDW